MAEERVARNTHSMVQRLEDLRIEHMSLINSMESPKTEISDIILKNIKSIDVGLDEAQLMMEFTLHLQNVDFEKQKLNAQMKQLSEENDNLREELAASKEKLQILERILGNARDETYTESTIWRQTYDENFLDFPWDEPLIESFSIDLVQDELIDYDSGDSDSTLTPRACINHSIHEDCDESEVFSRFRRTQTLANNYAVQGKYEVALPLCKEAIHDLKGTTVGRFHPYITKMMSLVGLVYGIQSKYQEATKLIHDAIREKIQPLSFGTTNIQAFGEINS